jgi:UDP-N-acetylmuramoyl-tripeptide--D-alanyl-D-alanine ligase
VIALTLSEIAAAVGGRLTGTDGAGGAVGVDRAVTSVVADSREVSPGALFVCIAGDRVDGHAFAAQAMNDGAIACLTTRPLECPCIVVEDVVIALGQLANWYRTQKLHATVIGITGSSGKTTTKDLLANVLSATAPTVAPKGSFNTEIGLPLTVLSADETTRFLVLEMGMRGIGHIADLMAIAEPSIGVFLNVGSAHVGVVGSREAIAQGKGEIIEALPTDGTAVLNGDDPLVMGQRERTRARVLTFGESSGVAIRAVDVRLDDLARASFTLEHAEENTVQRELVSLQYVGEHVVSDALAAAGVALTVGLRLGEIAAALSAAQPRSRWRMEVHELTDGITVINDAYNANPESMRAALKTLTAMGAGRRTWAVVGEMLELGPSSVSEHDAIGRLAVRLDISKFLCIGAGAKVMHLGAAQEGSWGDEAAWVPDVDTAVSLLRNELRAGDVVLIKASRSIGLERVADALIQSFGEATR